MRRFDWCGAMSGHKQSRAELEQLWRTRLLECGAKYESCVAEFRKVLEEQRQVGTSAGGRSIAERNALLRKSVARKEYIRVLRIFTDLLVSGKVPEED